MFFRLRFCRCIIWFIGKALREAEILVEDLKRYAAGNGLPDPYGKGEQDAYGWRGRIALRWTLAGFLVLMLAYVGSRFVSEFILGRI